MAKPAFLITIDTEADDLWARRKTHSTRNAGFLPRFQDLCEEFGLKPTYLTDWRMAGCQELVSFGRAVQARGTGEIGMHLHAWDTPPLEPITDDDDLTNPYLIEYSDRLMREKVRNTTARLEDAFGTRMVSHRSGRWSFDERYARILAEDGYLVDCSVTPRCSWKSSLGDPRREGGTDFRSFPDEAYWLDLDDVSRPGRSTLLEVPMTVLNLGPRIAETLDGAFSTPEGIPTKLGRFPRSALRRVFPQGAWLRPTGQNRDTLLRVVERVLADGRDYAEFMLHSSEFMPGGSPTFRDEGSIERLYADLRALFTAVRDRFTGMTLHEYHDRFVEQSRASVRTA